jgi:hypothetical protein
MQARFKFTHTLCPKFRLLPEKHGDRVVELLLAVPTLLFLVEVVRAYARMH